MNFGKTTLGIPKVRCCFAQPSGDILRATFGRFSLPSPGRFSRLQPFLVNVSHFSVDFNKF